MVRGMFFRPRSFDSKAGHSMAIICVIMLTIEFLLLYQLLINGGCSF